MSSKKAIVLATIISILSFLSNFFVFVYGYDRLAVPFLSEEQRVTNASFIMSVVLGAFAGSAIVLGVVLYRAFIARRRQ
jgi:hypothetical protein